ncbi:hypothetical protein EJ04DRAFT_597109 [Polyplosphaeria fusca]|uniref:Uncharacterized protein n=1 Tax=Polyplosphaeria fusca TaxID=682080 RepID=A0A9P4QID2_9PLEO|nr:hypothetical protein EJ04DRAFT_597109 [Polyplosphaeria fusca]
MSFTLSVCIATRSWSLRSLPTSTAKPASSQNQFITAQSWTLSIYPSLDRLRSSTLTSQASFPAKASAARGITSLLLTLTHGTVGFDFLSVRPMPRKHLTKVFNASQQAPSSSVLQATMVESTLHTAFKYIYDRKVSSMILFRRIIMSLTVLLSVSIALLPRWLGP